MEQDKAPYDLNRQTAKISALSSGNASKCEFLTGKDVLPEKDLLEKAATIKRFEYLPLGKELKAQTEIAKKQYQGLDKIYEFDETINKNDKKTTLKKYSKSELMYDANHSFYKYYRDNNKFDNLSFKSNCSFLANFFGDLDKINKLKSQKEKAEKKKVNVYNKASDLHNDLLAIYFNEYNELPDAQRNKMEHKYDPTKLFLETYNYVAWFENKESIDKEESTDTTRKSDKKNLQIYLTCQR